MLISLFQHHWDRYLSVLWPCCTVCLPGNNDTVGKSLKNFGSPKEMILPCKFVWSDNVQTELRPVACRGTALPWQPVLEICASWLGVVTTLTWVLSHTLLAWLFLKKHAILFCFYTIQNHLAFYYQNLIKLWLRKSTLLLQTIYSTINHNGVLSFALSPPFSSPPPSPFHSIRNKCICEKL